MKTHGRHFAFAALCAAALLALQSATACAQTRQYGAFEVHYSVFGSSFLQPGIAAAYGIVRAKDRAIVNIAVRRGPEPSATVSATLGGTRSDLIRETPLEFREIREEQAVYYIAEFRFVPGETQHFRVSIQPAGESRPLELEFSQVLYAD